MEIMIALIVVALVFVMLNGVFYALTGYNLFE